MDNLFDKVGKERNNDSNDSKKKMKIVQVCKLNIKDIKKDCNIG